MFVNPEIPIDALPSADAVEWHPLDARFVRDPALKSMGDRMVGFPVHQGSELADGTVYCGDFARALEIYEFEPTTMLADRYTLAETGVVRIIVHGQYGVRIVDAKKLARLHSVT